MQPHARYDLGSRIAHDVFNGHEVRLRVRACATAWVSLGSFWRTTDVLVFLARAQSAPICCLEAYILTKNELHNLDSSLVRKTRCIMRGGAHSVDAEGKHCTMTDGVVPKATGRGRGRRRRPQGAAADDLLYIVAKMSSASAFKSAP